MNPIRKLANFSELFANGTAGFARFLEIMRTEPQLQDAPDAQPLTHVRGEITIRDVSFSYEDDPEVLHDVSLSVPAGKTVAIVGPSGGGKTHAVPADPAVLRRDARQHLHRRPSTCAA